MTVITDHGMGRRTPLLTNLTNEAVGIINSTASIKT